MRAVRTLGSVLRLYDPQAAGVTEVGSARPAQLCTCTAGRPGEPADLRSHLLADLVRRVGERHRLLVRTWYRAGASGEAGPALRADWEALNIHPLGPAPGPPEQPDLVIGGEVQPADARWLRSAPAHLPGDPAAVAGRGLDPLALRLALLRHHYRKPAALTWDDLAAADHLLREWRAQVAAWADSPSRPIAASYAAGVMAAFDDDLDTPASLATLGTLAADPEVPPGSKFETFAYLDHLLGLDLARDIGR